MITLSLAQPPEWVELVVLVAVVIGFMVAISWRSYR